MDYIRVTKPGHYKDIKTQTRNRVCVSCPTTLSIYNSKNICSLCEKNMELVK